MLNLEAQQHIEECRRQLEKANEITGLDLAVSKAMGSLIIAIEQLSVIVEDLAQREQGTVSPMT